MPRRLVENHLTDSQLIDSHTMERQLSTTKVLAKWCSLSSVGQIFASTKHCFGQMQVGQKEFDQMKWSQTYLTLSFCTNFFSEKLKTLHKCPERATAVAKLVKHSNSEWRVGGSNPAVAIERKCQRKVSKWNIFIKYFFCRKNPWKSRTYKTVALSLLPFTRNSRPGWVSRFGD